MQRIDRASAAAGCCGYHPLTMGKFLLLIIVGVLLYLMLTRPRRMPRAKPDAAPAAAESMIQCAYCDVHLPLSESLAADGRRYCCEEHRRLGQG